MGRTVYVCVCVLLGGADVAGRQSDISRSFHSLPSQFKRYSLSSEKTFSSLFFPAKEALLRLLDHFTHRQGKFAVQGFGETLRIELADEGIGVSVFFPAGMASRHLESSQLAKPGAIAGPVVSQEDIDFMLASRKIDETSHVATPEHATRNLIAELTANPRYIVSHGKYRAEMAERLDDMLAAYDRAQD